MDSLIEQIIIDFQERDIPLMTPRDTVLPQLIGKIDTIIGMRRTGKTYLLYQIMQQLLKQGLPKTRLLYINFDDDRLLPLYVDQLRSITDIYYRLFPVLKKEKCYFFFDEIQNVPGWERYVRRLIDTEKIHLYLTGSSAKLLSKEIATTLRGRSIATEVFPFSFRESLLHENPDIVFSPHTSSSTKGLMENRIRRFLIQGGFPEVQSLTNEEYRKRILQEYVDVVILRDIIERHKVANAQALHTMARHLLGAPATSFSVNKFYHDLKSQGISCDKNALYSYLDYFLDTYLLFPIPIYSHSERVRRTNPKKIYIIDTGLSNAFSHRPQSNMGHLLENFVFIELRRKGLQIEYYRTNEETEVDFITTSFTGEKNLYQVALNIKESATREREIKALTVAMKECRLKKGYLITLDHQETLPLKTGTIEIIPAWYWALYRHL